MPDMHPLLEASIDFIAISLFAGICVVLGVWLVLQFQNAPDTDVDAKTKKLVADFHDALQNIDARADTVVWLMVDRAVHSVPTDEYILQTNEDGFKLPLTCSKELYTLVRRTLELNPGCHVRVRAAVDTTMLHVGRHDGINVVRPDTRT